MTEQKIIKRFIAGSVCPRCAELDKLVVYLNAENQQIRECVRCDFKDVMTDSGPAEIVNAEVETRVNQPRIGEQPLAHEDEVQVINVLEPKLKS